MNVLPGSSVSSVRKIAQLACGVMGVRTRVIAHSMLIATMRMGNAFATSSSLDPDVRCFIVLPTSMDLTACTHVPVRMELSAELLMDLARAHSLALLEPSAVMVSSIKILFLCGVNGGFLSPKKISFRRSCRYRPVFCHFS